MSIKIVIGVMSLWCHQESGTLSGPLSAGCGVKAMKSGIMNLIRRRAATYPV
jgi:hypothetical protein